jgi:ABC-2 type transport system permease protein
MNWPTPRRSAAIARVEYRRSLRALVKNPMQLLGVAFLVVFFIGAPTAGVVYAAYTFGDRILAIVPVLDGARGALSLLWLVMTFMVVSRAVGKTARIEHEAGMLTTVPAPDVVGGLVLAEAARLLTVIGVSIVVIAAALAAGIGAPTAFVSIVVALLAAFMTALLAGHIIGILVKIVIGQSELLTRYKSVLAVVAFLVYFVAVSSEAFGQFVTQLFPLLQDAPMAWFGDLLVAGVPNVAPSPVRMAGAVALVVIGVPVLVALDVRAATRLWYGDRAQPGTKTYSSSESNAAFLARIASGPTRTVTTKIWRRTKRAPFRLIYAAYPLFFLFVPLREAVTTGEIPASLPVLLALYGTWAIGAAALNPFGDEGAMLPVTLTGEIRGAEFVRGHVLAVTTIGLPLVVAVTAITGVLSPLAVSTWVSLTVASAVLCVLGPVVALAIGTWFPRFGTVRLTRSRRTVVPSKTAFACYTLVLAAGFLGSAVVLIPGGAGALSNGIGFLSGVLGFPIDIGASTLRLIGGGVALVLGVVAPPVAYRYVVRRFESYTLD